MSRRAGLPAGALAAVVVGFTALTGLGLWRLVAERETLLRTTLLERQETVGRAAAALASSVDRCWQSVSEQTPALAGMPEDCRGVAEDSSPYRWVRIAARRADATGMPPNTGALAVLLNDCAILDSAARFEGCKRAAAALAESGGRTLVESAGKALLDRVGEAREAAREYRLLAYRLLHEAFATAIEEQPAALDAALATPDASWARLGRFLVTRSCAGGARCGVTLGLDIEPTSGALARFVNAMNISGGARYALAMMSESEALANPADTVSTAFVSRGLGYLSARDKAPPSGLGALHLLLGAYAAAALLLLGALAVAVFLLDRGARELRLRQNFVASVSHELRTPLGSMRLMLETIIAGRLPEERLTTYVESMHQQVIRLSRLAENMLILQRLERRSRVDLQTCTLAPIIRTAVESLREDAAARGVALDVRLSEGELETLAVPDLLTIALKNLIHNAIKYSPPQGTVTITLERLATRLALHVCNEGAGIPVREQERVFDWFYRVGDELTRESQGTGVGLPIVRAVAEVHHADVRFVESDAPGCHVVFSLPLAKLEIRDG